MGKEYFKRPLAVNLTTGGSTVTSFDDVRIAGALTVAGAQTVSGALTVDTSLTLPVQTLTASTALQNLASTAVVHVLTETSGAGRDFRLPAPTAGAVHVISVSPSTSPGNTIIFTNTTAQTFFGSTFNQIALAAGATAAGARGAHTLLLVGVSTSQWALLRGTTASFALSASTGSTGQ